MRRHIDEIIVAVICPFICTVRHRPDDEKRSIIYKACMGNASTLHFGAAGVKAFPQALLYSVIRYISVAAYNQSGNDLPVYCHAFTRHLRQCQQSRICLKGPAERVILYHDLILIMEGVDEGKACSGNALMIPRDLCHSLLKHLFAKAEDIPQSFVTEPEGYKIILNVAEAIRDSAESKD